MLLLPRRSWWRIRTCDQIDALADHPTGDLDRTTANEILKTLQTLNRDLGKTIVMVTHDPEAAKFATRTLHLDKGRFVEQGAA